MKDVNLYSVEIKCNVLVQAENRTEAEEAAMKIACEQLGGEEISIKIDRKIIGNEKDWYLIGNDFGRIDIYCANKILNLDICNHDGGCCA